MNKYVKLIIELYYDEIKIPGLSKYIRYDLNGHYLYEWDEICNNDKLLIEEYHTISIFDKAIADILSLYSTSKLNYEIYTGWNYSIKNKICTKQNNQNIDIPIYIIIVYNDQNNIYAAILDHSDKIVIELNKSSIESLDENIDVNVYVRTCLMHELFHAREMFAIPNKNILLSNKNTSMPYNEKNMFLWDKDNRYLKKAWFICNMLSDSEIRARLNAVNYKLNNISDNILKKYTNRKELIQYCMLQTDNMSLYEDILYEMQLLDVISENAVFGLEVILYYGYKYNIIKTKLNSYNFKNKKPYMLYTSDELEQIHAGFFELKYKLTQFKRRLMDIIYHNLSKRELI